MNRSDLRIFPSFIYDSANGLTEFIPRFFQVSLIIATIAVPVIRCRAAESSPALISLPANDAWPFQTDDDPFSSAAALDLGRMLNEKSAGETGFVGLSSDHMSFVRGDGQPIRFWAVVSEGFNLKPEEMERHAAWLSKRGVNMVRVHAQLCRTKEGSKITDVETKTLDGILRWVAVCKHHGIYLTISPYWAHTKAPASWGLEGYEDEELWGLLFFNLKLQEGYRAWVKALYTTPNPYAGGVALKDEPAVAIVQAQNEDSLLFWTFNEIKPAQRRLLGSAFFAWAGRRFGSLEKALLAWENVSAEGDDLPKAILGFRSLWEYTSAAPAVKGGLARRLASQLEFLTETQRHFYSEMEHYFKKELRIGSLTNAMNWRSADQVTLDDAERFSYTPMDVIAVNYYSGGAHLGPNDGYRIDPGDRFTNATVLKGTAPLPANLKQTLGHPLIVTETAWVLPSLYQSEGPFLMAAYQSLSGVAASYWFAFPGPDAVEWMKDPRALFWPVGKSHATWKWYGNHAMQAGQFPAWALAFRLGYIAQAKEPAVYEERSYDDLWQHRTPIISESGRFDPNRDSGSFAPASPLHQEVPREAFFVGPVRVKVGGEAKHNRVVDLSRYFDRTTGEIRSLTGQLVMNQKKGICTLDAPQIQGVCGFLKEAGGSFRLSTTKWYSTNHYAALVAVSLDGKPLATSRRILLQAGTTAKLSGATTEKTLIKDKDKELPGEEIIDNGMPPWLVSKTHATLTLANPYLTKATILNPNLYPEGPAAVTQHHGAAVIELPEEALYTILE